MIVCVLLPRFALSVAAGGRAELARGPVALAPEPGREPLIGEASAAAEAHGVRAGLRLGEALARCPALKLVAPDPAGVADQWDRVLAALEGIGAAVESERPGVACFDAGGLLNLHGGLEGVLAVTRRALGVPARLGVASSRFAAIAAASRARPRRAEVAPGVAPPLGARRPGHGVSGGSSSGRAPAGGSSAGGGPFRAGRRARDPLAAYLAPLPIALLGTRAETAALPEPLERFGIRTLGELAALPRAALADRFGAAGPLARDLARGRDTPLVPRRAAERLEEALELPESGSGAQLEHALGLLIDRLVARRERRGRTFRAVVLSAELVEGGTWQLRMTLREAHADPRRMRLALAPRLAELPAPADVLRLRVEGLGPPAGLQRSLIAEPAAIRAARLREAVRQARAVAGPDAALRIVPVDPDSRVPERRHTLAPWDP
jgi:protein ImuB